MSGELQSGEQMGYRVKENLVLETTSHRAARDEQHDWQKLGYNSYVTATRERYRSGYGTVYRVWVRESAKGGSRDETVGQFEILKEGIKDDEY